MLAMKPILYLASPSQDMQFDHMKELPVLMSFGATGSAHFHKYQHVCGRMLLDSGAFSEINSGKKIDLEEYIDWSQKFLPQADAAAGLDDISGNWKRSLKNYTKFGFPTIHPTDPPELLKDLIDIARERGNWIGVGGLASIRRDCENWVRQIIDRIPEDLHVHCWGSPKYSYIIGFDSFDTSGWLQIYWAINYAMPWLTPGEAIELSAKRVMRERNKSADVVERGLFT